MSVIRRTTYGLICVTFAAMVTLTGCGKPQPAQPQQAQAAQPSAAAPSQAGSPSQTGAAQTPAASSPQSAAREGSLSPAAGASGSPAGGAADAGSPAAKQDASAGPSPSAAADEPQPAASSAAAATGEPSPPATEQAAAGLQPQADEPAQPPQAAAPPATAGPAPSASADTRTVELSIVGDKKHGVILTNTSVPFEDGDTIFDILQKTVKQHKIQMEYKGRGSTVYIEGIDNLYEFDDGPKSGWVYIVNGQPAQRGAGSVKPAKNDKIEWVYTLDLGKDVGVKTK